MTEQEAIDGSTRPATVASLVADLRNLGVDRGMTVMVHSSLSKLGYVSGGAQAVVMALLEVIGPDGTLAMPTHSGDLSDPAQWSNPPVPEAWWEQLRAEMPAYDQALTPTRWMGSVVECFRHVSGALRSAHPTVSAAAVGPNAEFITAGHQLAHGLGESSPQARLYELDGQILLLGVTHANNTSLHLAQYRSTVPGATSLTQASPVIVDGCRQWVSYPNLDVDDDDFSRLGEAFSATEAEQVGPVGNGVGRLMRSRDLVDFATSWMVANATKDDGT